MAPSTGRVRVLAVGDDLFTAHELGETLRRDSYDVRTAVGGRQALGAAREWRPALVIADLSAPLADIVDLWRFLRDQLRVSIIVLSKGGAEKDRIDALDAGADYCLVKPVGAAELTARVRAVLRRSRCESGFAFAVGDFRLDPGTLCVRVRGMDVQLTRREFDLFMFMARRPRCVIDHRTLLTEIWGEAARAQTEYLRVYMGQLRKKLELRPSRPRYLVTEPWVGYSFNPDGRA